MIFILRHGVTKKNNPENERVRGWGNDSLDEEGREQAKSLIPVLKPLGIDVIFSSDLPRSEETAEIIGDGLGISYYPVEELRTWHVGHFQGQLWQKVEEQMAHYQENPYKHVPRGEPYHAFYKRFHDAFMELRKLKQTVLLVLHGRQVWALPSVLTNGAKGIPMHGPPNPGDVMSINDNGNMRYVRRGDYGTQGS